jgi:putative tricarboxylic transport membrane protein
MKLSDTLSGLLTLTFGIAIVAYATTFPPMPGQPVGPSLFPIVIGTGMAVFGAGLILAGLRHRTTPWIEAGEWVRHPRLVLRFVLVVADVVAYALVVGWLGFFITSVAFLTVLLLAFGVTRRWIVPIAGVVTLGVHYVFYTLLHVPLPWGLLGGLAW